MNLWQLVWKEIRQRPTAMAASGLAILLGVAALVAIRHVTLASEAEVSRQLTALGANVLILPKSASVEDYYAADLNGQTLAEENASRVLLANLAGVEKLSPKLCLPTTLGDWPVTVTGILPQSDFKAQGAWQTAGMFAKKEHVGCKRATCSPRPKDDTPQSLIRQRTIEKLGKRDAVVGADAADRANLFENASVMLWGQEFRVVAVLPRTGTVDDSRVFIHLHSLQDLADTGEVVNAIEVLACCQDAAGDLVPKLSELLPDAKIITISHVVETQVGVNKLLGNLSLFVLVVLVVVGGVSVAGAISSNVRERRREIGTLMALGASPGLIGRMFVLKALSMGLVGGVLGAGIGVATAIVAAPYWAGVTVTPLPSLAALAVGVAILVSLAAAWWPARQAARLDPCSCFKEI